MLSQIGSIITIDLKLLRMYKSDRFYVHVKQLNTE